MSDKVVEENHGGYKILRGVRSDIKKLLDNFESTGSVRYSDFSSEWKKMKFSLIFRERKNLPELLEFCEETIHIAKGYLAQPFKFHTRIGALYILYGLYYKQPIKGAAKIRFTKEEWEPLCDFINECKEGKHFDAAFIHYKLYAGGAYVFTAIPRATGFERGFRKYEEVHNVNKSIISDMISKKKEVIEPDILSSLVYLETLYSDKKSQLLGKKNLEFVEKNFATSLKRKLDNFYNKSSSECLVGNDVSSSDVCNGEAKASSSLDTTEENTIAARRSRIRSKAFAASPGQKSEEGTGSRPRRIARATENLEDDSQDDADVDRPGTPLSLPNI